MARLNIEEDAWKRVYRLAELMECDVREAAGTAALLWSRSQDVVRTHGTKDEIVEWASLFKTSETVLEKWFSALQKVRFISIDDSGLFKIHGNDVQLKSLASHISRASKGGKALKKKLRDVRKLQAGFKQAPSTLEASSEQAPSLSMQDNARQCKTKQSNAIQDNAEQPDPAPPQAEKATPKDLAKLWNDKVHGISIFVPDKDHLPKVDLKHFHAKQERYKNAKDRLKENPDLSFWGSVIDAVLRSPGCRGKNDRQWLANFDFLVRPDTHVNALDGKYDKWGMGQHPQARASKAQQLTDQQRDQWERIERGEL